MINSNRFFAVASFFALDEHALAVVKLSEAQIARFQHLRETLGALHVVDDGIVEIVVDAQPVIWCACDDDDLTQREAHEITGDEWEKQVKALPADDAQPDTAHVHVTLLGLYFSCTTECDNGNTETIEWSELETQ